MYTSHSIYLVNVNPTGQETISALRARTHG